MKTLVPLIKATLLCLFFAGVAYSQVNCSSTTPFFNVDLTGTPSGTWVSPPVVRDGSCCGGGANQVNCIEVSITLDPGAEGIIFQVASGANPGGALYYQINCQGAPVASGSGPICLNGVGPHLISYCKVGNNTNTYSITSVPAPTSSGNVYTADGCSDTLSVSGLDPASVTWTSISPGTPGQYNNYLNNFSGTSQGTSGVPYTGQASVIVTPQPGYPNEIEYQVCGDVVGGCSSLTFCDTVTTFIYPTLFGAITPVNPAICFGAAGETLTAVPTGGAAPYSYYWTGPSANGSTSQSIFATAPGTYTVEISDATGCPPVTASVTVTQFANPITADAGPDQVLCGTPPPTVSLTGVVTGTTTGIWSGGSGTYVNGDTSLGLQYIPSPSEIAGGSATLILTTTNNGSCPPDSDTVTISFTQFTATLTTAPTHISCFGLANGTVDLAVSGGAGPFTYNWSTGSTNEDISNLSAGNYTVMVTDIYGCTGSISDSIIEPTPLTQNSTSLTYNGGWNVSCNGASDGAIDLTIAGGTPGYTYLWSNGATTEDISGLPAGTYSVAATDANGCTISTSVTLNEPTPLTQNSTSLTYNGGWNVSCNGASDGAIDLTIGGGTPGYTYLWSNGATTEDISGLLAGTYSVTATDANGCTISTAITLNEPTPLTQNSTALTYNGGWNVSCNGASDGAIDLTIGGGTPGYTYLWSNGATTEDISGLTAGTYSVTATDANGCTISTSVTLNEPTPLTQNSTSLTYNGGWNVSCNGASDGAIDLTIGGGTPGYTYLWSNGTTTEDISGLPAGTYSVTATDANGCTISTSVTLNEPPVLQATANVSSNYNGQDLRCFGSSDGSLTGNTSGGTPAYTFSWADAAGNTIGSAANITGLPAGTYMFTVNDINGCTTSTSVTIQAPPPLTLSPFVSSDYNGWGISCNGVSDGAIDLTAGGGTPSYQYQWQNSSAQTISTGQSAGGLPAGMYFIIITDANGCTLEDSIEVSQPPALSVTANVASDYNGSDVSCTGMSDGSAASLVNGGTPGYSYSWTDSGNGQPIGGNSNVLTGIGAGTYEVTATDLNGCQVTAQVTLTDPPPVFANLDALTDYFGAPVSCVNNEDGTIEVIYGGGIPEYTIIWEDFPDSISSTLSQIGTGNYQVTVYDANGCAISTDITLYANPLPTYTPGPDTSICLGESASVSCVSAPGNTVEWNFSNGMQFSSCDIPVIQPGEAGCLDAEVTITSPLGCTITDLLEDYICVQPLPDADFYTTPPTVSFLDPHAQFVNTSYNASSFEWNFGDGSANSNESDPDHLFPDEGAADYEVTLIATSDFGCTDTIIQLFRVSDELIFYVPNAFTPDADEYNNSFFPVFYSGYDPYSYSILIFDRWGELIFESHDTQVGWDGTYRGELAKEGVYTWKISFRRSQAMGHVVKTGHVTLLR